MNIDFLNSRIEEIDRRIQWLSERQSRYVHNTQAFTKYGNEIAYEERKKEELINRLGLLWAGQELL